MFIQSGFCIDSDGVNMFQQLEAKKRSRFRAEEQFCMWTTVSFVFRSVDRWEMSRFGKVTWKTWELRDAIVRGCFHMVLLKPRSRARRQLRPDQMSFHALTSACAQDRVWSYSWKMLEGYSCGAQHAVQIHQEWLKWTQKDAKATSQHGFRMPKSRARDTCYRLQLASFILYARIYV